MDRLHLIAPALLLFATMLIALVVFTWLSAVGRAPPIQHAKHNQLLGAFMGRYIAWVVGPIERALLGRVSPNTVTVLSLLSCAASGAAAAIGHLGTAAWLYACGGLLDIIDGRLARLAARQTKAGALLDSVCDRWSEMFVLTGYAWLLRDTSWLLSVIAAMGSSLMVSYTRARAEGLGLDVPDGLMQRAERIVVVTLGAFVAAWFADGARTIMGVAMTICALGSLVTAIGRLAHAFRTLARIDADAANERRRSRMSDGLDRAPARLSLLDDP